MKPIISPWWIYLIDLFNNLKEVLGVALFLLGCTAVALLIIWLFSSLDYNERLIVACKKYL